MIISIFHDLIAGHVGKDLSSPTRDNRISSVQIMEDKEKGKLTRLPRNRSDYIEKIPSLLNHQRFHLTSYISLRATIGPNLVKTTRPNLGTTSLDTHDNDSFLSAFTCSSEGA